jgi:histone-lysine N-methyltransferase MLL2
MPLLAPDDAPLDIPLLPEPDEPEPLDDPDPLDDPEPLLEDPLDDDPDEDDPLDDIDPEEELPEEGEPLLESDDPEDMESLDPLLDGVCVVPDVLLVKAPVV